MSKREVRRHGWRWDDEEVAAADSQATFAEGVELFNAGEYYECHDVLEGLWNNAPEPTRSIFHGILQCSVGLYHLLHQVLNLKWGLRLDLNYVALLEAQPQCGDTLLSVSLFQPSLIILLNRIDS